MIEEIAHILTELNENQPFQVEAAGRSTEWNGSLNFYSNPAPIG